MITEPNRTEEVFSAALQRKAGPERAAFLDGICGDDAALREHVEALLSANDSAGDFLESPVQGAMVTADGSSVIEGPGSVIGPYKLLEKIGEGGMAVVYMANQEKPIRRRVALKIIKLGMDTKEVIGRFEIERRALALMDHPNIARILDAGVTDTGRPYFVMELVKGISITQYCDKHKLSTRERLDLFIPVCNAVHHAHQKGIIHRDLKPSNIMVTMYDGKPVPMVIDFGIAKATNRQLTERTVFTRYAQMIGTPEYMSPEQAEMSGMDVDIRTDIYSLGVVLYELLTGALPFDPETLRSAAFGEIQRIIREEEPLRPSTRLSKLGEDAEKIAAQRSTNAATLVKRLSQELEWIPLKAMRKDRTRRYRSTAEFSDDIQNYLSDVPLLAGPESTLYRCRKLFHKYRLPVGVISAVAAALIIGLVISTSLYFRMRQALHTVSELEDKVEVDSKLSTVERLYAEGRYQAALNEIELTLHAQNLGPKAHLLRARLLVEVGQMKEAEAQLLPLTKSERGIAGAAHYLLARVNVGVDTAKSDEHEALARSMLPETAEAYSLRAMTAPNLEQALRWLDRAIELDPAHYPSRKARALIYYALDEGQKIVPDVEALIALRPADFLGYALRAVLRSESGLFEQAIEDFGRAIKFCESKTELAEVYEQRYVAYTKMGDHASALKDARRLAELAPQEFQHRSNIFRSLLALGDLAAAQSEYRSIVQTSYEWDRSIRSNAVYYAIDIVDGDRSLDVPGDMVDKAPFAQMREAAQYYRLIRSRATRLENIGLGVPYAWSPDGKKLLCGWMRMYGAMQQRVREAVPSLPRNAGLKIVDLESGQETFVADSHGGIPAWSPDGKYVAYPDRQDDLYVVTVADGQSRKIAPGHWPQWSDDSQRLYYNTSWGWGDLCCININDPDPVPKKLMPCSCSFAVCEAENWVAYCRPTGVSIVELSSGSPIDDYPYALPQYMQVRMVSGDRRELSFTGWYPHVDNGPFILDTQDKQWYQAFGSPIHGLVRSPDGSRLAIGVRRDFWIMEMDPNLSIRQAFGRATSGNDLITGQIAIRTREIAADPEYPENYLRRALAYMSLDQFANAQSDLKRFDELVTSEHHNVNYEMFWWLSRYCSNKLYDEAELLASHAEKLMDRFPQEVPSYRDLIEGIVSQSERRGKTELAARWRARLRELDESYK